MIGKRSLAIGPEATGVGSWDWIGKDMAQSLSADFSVRLFPETPPPDSDLCLLVKYIPDPRAILEATRNQPLVYMPVDFFGSAAEIDAYSQFLRRCSRVITHQPLLTKYFQSYARTEFIDHHTKYVCEIDEERESEDFILWVGMQTNLPPLAAWLSSYPLDGRLKVLTNVPASDIPQANSFGFSSDVEVEISSWSPQRHLAACDKAKAAIDIKGDDFRQRHKPPAKAIDFIASGLPLAMNPDSSSARHLLSRYGLELADPRDTGRWWSEEYRTETRNLGRALRETLSQQRVACRLRTILGAVLYEHNGTG